MKRLFCWCAALALGVGVATLASAQNTVKQAGYRSDSDNGNAPWAVALDQLGGNVELASCTSCLSPADDCGCEVGCADTCGPSLLSLNGLFPRAAGGRYFIGGEWLSVRANPSEAVTYLHRDTDDFFDTFHQFMFDYQSSFRVYGGWQNCCGEQIQFTWTRFDNDSSFASPNVPDASGTTQFISPLEVVATINGSHVEGSTNVKLDSFDLGWSKTIPLGSPLGCDAGCGDCCDPCGDGCCGPCGGWCPAWDITFTGAVRGVNMSAARNFRAVAADDSILTTARSSFDFDGLGARVGMMGRRYFGHQGVCSVYLKGDISVLAGNYGTLQQRQDLSGTVAGPVIEQSISCRHVIPVTEVEAGGTVMVTCNTSLSGGYFLSAWHDLGFRDEYDYGLQTSYDDGNIMGFDGFFLRMQTMF